MSRKSPGPEEQLQRTVVEWLRWQKPDCVWFFVNNGARLSKAQAGKAIGMGVLPGVADLAFTLPGGQSAFIELKAEGAYLSAVQRDFSVKVQALGAWYALARSIEDVQGTLKAWGVTFAHGRAA